MRPHCIEVPTPGLDDHASLCERVEDLAVEKFIAQPCIEALVSASKASDLTADRWRVWVEAIDRTRSPNGRPTA